MSDIISAPKDSQLSDRHHIILATLEFRLQSQNESFNALEQKAQQSINISGILAAVIGGFTIGSQMPSPSEHLYLLLAIVITFFLNIVVALAAVRLRNWSQPISLADEQVLTLQNWYKNGLDDVVAERMFYTYLDSLTKNEKVLKSKHFWTRYALILLCIQLVISLVFILARLNLTIAN